MGAARRRRRQCAARGRGADREKPDRPRKARRARSARSQVPAIPAPAGDEQSTQAAFGRILLDLAKAGGELADRIVTTSPDVTVSTNLGAWVNQRGLFRREAVADVFAQAKIASAQKWARRQQGPAHRARHRREQPVPDARRSRPRRRPVRDSGCSRSGRSTTRSSPAASMRSITPATRMRASSSSRRRAGSRSARKAARTSRSTRP